MQRDGLGIGPYVGMRRLPGRLIRVRIARSLREAALLTAVCALIFAYAPAGLMAKWPTWDLRMRITGTASVAIVLLIGIVALGDLVAHVMRRRMGVEADPPGFAKHESDAVLPKHLSWTGIAIAYIGLALGFASVVAEMCFGARYAGLGIAIMMLCLKYDEIADAIRRRARERRNRQGDA